MKIFTGICYVFYYKIVKNFKYILDLLLDKI